jgi:hypothetical protein
MFNKFINPSISPIPTNINALKHNSNTQLSILPLSKHNGQKNSLRYDNLLKKEFIKKEERIEKERIEQELKDEAERHKKYINTSSNNELESNSPERLGVNLNPNGSNRTIIPLIVPNNKIQKINKSKSVSKSVIQRAMNLFHKRSKNNKNTIETNKHTLGGFGRTKKRNQRIKSTRNKYVKY